MRKPHRLFRPPHFALVVALAAAGVALWVPSASAVVCVPNPNVQNVRAAASDTDNELRLAANGSNLEVNGVSCGPLTTIDTVTVDMQAASGARVVFDLAGGPLGPGATNEGNDSSEIEFEVIGLSSAQGRIHVDGSAGADGIEFGSGTVNQINLNAESDAQTPDVDVTFGSISALSADGKAGNDGISAAGVLDLVTPYQKPVTFTAGTGTNNLMGGTANDQFRILTETTSTGTDTVLGGGGSFDAVTILTQSSNLTSEFSLDGMANDGVGCPGIDCEGDNIGSDIAQIAGSSANETLIGREGNFDVLVSNGGEDELYGLGGPDTLFCAGGSASGGEDDDAVVVQAGCDHASGGGGRDQASFGLAGGAVAVTLDGVANDGEPGALMNVAIDIEDVEGSNFGDLIIGNGKRNLLRGGSGSDDLRGKGGSDRLEGLRGNDSLNGGTADDRLLGGAGNDTLNGGEGVDLCKQGPGSGTMDGCE